MHLATALIFKVKAYHADGLGKCTEPVLEMVSGDTLVAREDNFNVLDDPTARFFLQSQSLCAHLVRELVKMGNALEVSPAAQRAMLRAVFTKHLHVLAQL